MIIKKIGNLIYRKNIKITMEKKIIFSLSINYKNINF